MRQARERYGTRRVAGRGMGVKQRADALHPGDGQNEVRDDQRDTPERAGQIDEQALESDQSADFQQTLKRQPGTQHDHQQVEREYADMRHALQQVGQKIGPARGVRRRLHQRTEAGQHV